MRVLCDENLPLSLARRLRDVGHDAQDIRERGLRGAPDDHVLQVAIEDERVLVTLDARRFGNVLLTPPSSTPGIVLVRMPAAGTPAIIERVVRFMAIASEARLRGILTILEANRTRRRA